MVLRADRHETRSRDESRHDHPALSLLRTTRANAGSGTRIYVCDRTLVRFSAAEIPVCRLRRLFPKSEDGVADGDGRTRGKGHLPRTNRALRNLPMAGGLR